METWEAYVHEGESVSDRRKYTLLRQSLDGHALAAISLPKTEEYYETAIKILTDKYSKPDVMQQARLQAIISLLPVKKSDDFKGLRDLHDKAISLALGLGDPKEKDKFNDSIATFLAGKMPLEFASQMAGQIT